MTDPTVSNVHSLVTREEALSTLDDLVRSSARRMLQAALEREADDYVKAHAHLRDECGHRVAKQPCSAHNAAGRLSPLRIQFHEIAVAPGSPRGAPHRSVRAR